MVNTREHILKISFQLFLQKGFKDVTLREIVEKTGMSKGAFYHYFKSKEQVFRECLDFTIATAMNIYDGRLSKDSLYDFYHDYFKYNNLEMFLSKRENDEDPSLELNVFTLFFEGIKLFPDFQDKIVESIKAELDAWKEIVQIAREKGEIKSVMSDERIAKIFVFSADGIGMRNSMLKGKLDETAESIIEFWDHFYESIKC